MNAELGSVLSMGKKIDKGSIELIINHGQSIGIGFLAFDYEGETFFYVKSIDSLAARASHFLVFLNGNAWSDKPTISDIMIEMEKHNYPPMARNKLTKILDYLSKSGAIEEESYQPPHGGRPTKRYHIKDALKVGDYM